MSCPNCKIFHNKCKSECCAIVPIPRITFALNFHRIVRPVAEQVEFSRGMIIPVTKTGACCFLNTDFSCNIYESRPDVCEKFGNETHINLSCAFQTKDGEERTKKDREKVHAMQKRKLDAILK